MIKLVTFRIRVNPHKTKRATLMGLRERNTLSSGGGFSVLLSTLRERERERERANWSRCASVQASLTIERKRNKSQIRQTRLHAMVAHFFLAEVLYCHCQSLSSLDSVTVEHS